MFWSIQKKYGFKNVPGHQDIGENEENMELGWDKLNTLIDSYWKKGCVYLSYKRKAKISKTLRVLDALQHIRIWIKS